MRLLKKLQRALREEKVNFSGGDELDEMGRVLDLAPGITGVYLSVLKDVIGSRERKSGREGLSAERIVRLGILRKRGGYTYRELSDVTKDSLSVRRFLDLRPGECISCSAIHGNLKAVHERTWEQLNTCLIEYAKVQGYEDGKSVRGDTTTVETNIHYPTDASLLNDCVRVLARTMAQAQEIVGTVVKFVDHRRRAKAKVYLIHNTRKEERRHAQYLELIRVTRKTVAHASQVLVAIARCSGADMNEALRLEGCAAALRTYIPRAKKVIDQAYRRVVKHEAVPSAEKIVSIFEEHTDIIVKGFRDVVFGHKVSITTGVSCLILSIKTLEGNPKDSTLVPEVLANHKQAFGTAPKRAAFDGCFASTANRDLLKQEGVEELTFCKNLNMPPESLCSSKRIHKLLRRFRAGIEGSISFLKRIFSFDRVMDRTEKTFHAALKLGAAACNLTILARYNLAAAST